MKLRAHLTFFFLSMILASCSSEPIRAEDRPAKWAQKVEIQHNDNVYKIDQKLYRSAQPSGQGMQELEAKGIKEVLNLRYFHSDDDEVKGTKLVTHRIPMVAHNITYPEIVEALKIIQKANKPILVHCLHGSDRTGTIVAAYRIAIQDWDKEEAIREMKLGGYGFHHLLFPNLPEMLRELDVEKLKKDIQP